MPHVRYAPCRDEGNEEEAPMYDGPSAPRIRGVVRYLVQHNIRGHSTDCIDPEIARLGMQLNAECEDEESLVSTPNPSGEEAHGVFCSSQIHFPSGASLYTCQTSTPPVAPAALPNVVVEPHVSVQQERSASCTAGSSMPLHCNGSQSPTVKRRLDEGMVVQIWSHHQ